ncbi:MAG TPA: AIR synthase-related protein, partial [Clostridiales bacterium]|nr:AIR synthase-related protein [Clostridiales bacterium]
MVYRVYVEKKKGLAHEAAALLNDIRTNLGVTSLKNIRIFNRYDVENISKELFDDAISAVFSEPMVDDVYYELPNLEDAYIFAVEFLPGQYDQRADSAAQCIQLISQKDRPLVRTAKVYALFGELTESEIGAIKKYLINPVESREAALELPQTLNLDYDIPQTVETLDGFIDLKDEDIKEFVKKYALAMDEDDLKFCIEYFKSEGRNPTITELRVLDTYWSDHCRHTTFLTTIDSVEIDDAEIKSAYDLYLTLRAETGRADKKINLMDIATIGARYLKKQGLLEKLDESDEINACTVKIDVDIDGENEEWLLLFKNETHNHPTEIEPFGGAATCIGGAIRDPLSGRAYVYQAMRVTGAGNPLKPLSETIEGKLPQRKIVTTAADGYSSYGNQIGLATGLVDEIYHEGYVAKRLEIGAVVGAVPKKNVRREVPAKGDLVILVGGRTGRDGCGGATGSSKSHDSSSIEKSGAEVQKGNAPEERKLQRLFRNPEVVRLIKRCNDFGAGGVSVAVGEIADSLRINLNKVKKKYEGLDGTELAISESQERMAVVVEEKDAEKFIAFANEENLEATVIAEVTDNNRLVMEWNGRVIVDISRDFLNSNGAEKHTKVKVKTPADWNNIKAATDFTTAIKELAGDLN